MARELAVALLNGSVASTVALALAAQKHRPIAVYVDASPAGTAAGERRARAVDAIAQQLKSYRVHKLPAPFLANARATPSGSLVGSLPLFGLASSVAAEAGARSIHAGHHVGADADALARATELGQAWSEILQHACGLPELGVAMPLLELEPWQIVDLGVQVGAPLELAWSCEGNGAEPCGACAGCRSRDAAFARSAHADPQKRSAARRG